MLRVGGQRLLLFGATAAGAGGGGREGGREGMGAAAANGGMRGIAQFANCNRVRAMIGAGE